MTDELVLKEDPEGLKELQLEIGKWSRANFGMQHSKVIPGTPPINELAPLLGIVEELGELFEAEDDEEAQDALGDIAIYLMDYCCRSAIIIDTLLKQGGGGGERDPERSLVATIGSLCHAELKRHQGIRGMDDFEKFKTERNSTVVRLWHYLDTHAQTVTGYSAFDLAKMTYVDIVKKRNWKESPQDGTAA